MREYEEALKETDFSKVELVLFAGDMIYKGKWYEFSAVLKITRKYTDKPIYACFGNEEYDDIIPLLTKKYSEVFWINDNYTLIELGGKEKLWVIGSKGVLDRPTRWQRKNIPNIEEIYRKRTETLKELLVRGKTSGYTTILLIHYPPTYTTLVGEPRYAWPEMASSKMESVLRQTKPDIVVHGHSHNSKKTFTMIGSTRVYNVSLPATKKITIIPIKWGLLGFF